ncbi:MAG: nucleotidyltransferase family protein [Terriglobales bacterium]
MAMGYRFNYRDKLPQIEQICHRYEVRELWLFGSALGPNFRGDSDLDFLVEFKPGARVGLLRFNHLQSEFGDTLQWRVDLVPKQGLKPLIRDSVLRSAELVYAG